MKYQDYVIKDGKQKLDSCFQLVVCKEVLWYMLDDLNLFKERIHSISSKYVYVSQSLPHVENYLGKEYSVKIKRASLRPLLMR